MLQSWIGSTINQRQGLMHSFSGRGDPWPAFKTGSTDNGMGSNEFGSIAEGLLAGTMVATEFGWQPVEDLQTGDRVVTFDNGMQRLKAVQIAKLWTAEGQAPRGVWPLEIPQRALGNRTAMRLLPEQTVLIESDEAEQLFGDAFSMVAAGTLDGYKGITRVPPQREMTVVTLVFDSEEVVYVNGTLLAHCPAPGANLLDTLDSAVTIGDSTPYPRLTTMQARTLVDALHDAH